LQAAKAHSRQANVIMITFQRMVGLMPRAQLGRLFSRIFKPWRLFGFAIASMTAAAADLRASELQVWTGGDRPAFVLPDLNGADIALRSRHGSMVLVHFFATWCEPCRDELPALRRLVARSADVGVTVLAVSVAEVDERVRRFFETMPVNFPILLDRDRAVAKAWEVNTLPTTFVLDGTHTPRLVVEGEFSWDSITAEAMMQAVLRTRSDAPGSKSLLRRQVETQGG
jgi:peroxiredoxin